jgi:hypothetical protein
MYQLNWEPAQAHGSQVTLYRLESLIIDNNQKNESEHWNLCYNGTDSYWIITDNTNEKYRFRVQAKNAYGFGTWSKPSMIIDLIEFDYRIPIGQQLILSCLVILIITTAVGLIWRRKYSSST